MIRDDIIRMAREAGFETDCGPLLPESASIKVGGLYVGVQPLLERFAALVVAAEREACIKLLEDFSETRMTPVVDTWRMGLIAGANVIRARGQE
jgi:hypothetical protein